MLLCRTAGVAQTRALGSAVAELVETGDVLLLAGDLGAGKTAFVQGFAAGLGVTAPVTSPTFTLANRYQGRIVVNHVDVYRFERLEEVRDLALPELIEEGVTLVEWGDVISSETACREAGDPDPIRLRRRRPQLGAGGLGRVVGPSDADAAYCAATVGRVVIAPRGDSAAAGSHINPAAQEGEW